MLNLDDEEVCKCKEVRGQNYSWIGLKDRDGRDANVLNQLEDAATTGRWRAWVLGFGIDPVTLKPDIFLLSLISRDILERTCPDGRIPSEVEYGRTHFGDGWGRPLNEIELASYLERRENTLPAGQACCKLAIDNLSWIRLQISEMQSELR